MNVKEDERARAMCALAAVELNMSELHGLEDWWESIGPEWRHEWLEFQGVVRAYQFVLQNRPRQPLDEAEGEDGVSRAR